MKSYLKKPEPVIPDTNLGPPKTRRRTNQSLSITADSPRCRKQRGFTLIELMIVLAIIGILFLFAVPAYLGYTVKAHLTNVPLKLASFGANIELRKGDGDTIEEICSPTVPVQWNDSVLKSMTVYHTTGDPANCVVEFSIDSQFVCGNAQTCSAIFEYVSPTSWKIASASEVKCDVEPPGGVFGSLPGKYWFKQYC